MVQRPDKFHIKFDARLLFLGLIIILFFLNYYSKTMFFRPSGMHQWRQADCLSIAKNYYEEGMHFFEPKIHYAGVSDGKAVSECPILNYTAASLWKVFGEKEFIYRLMEYLIFILAMYVFFIVILKKYASPVLAFFSVGLLLTSPLLVFYSLNFIADVPALSLCIISFCTFYKFYETKSIKYFYLALLVGTLAVLMKASALMGLSILFFFSAIDLFGLTKRFKTEILFNKKVGPSIALFLSVVTLVAWYKFALQYNNNNNNNVFLLTVLPIWELDQVEIIRN
ncbi:MAG: glycosyltransferase family 39 protein, partial [Bacteroidota bacterium]